MWYDESIRRTNIMKNKFLLTLSILSTAIVLSACGSDTSDVSVENTETEIVASVDTETETIEETTETEKIESTEITDTETESTETADTEEETEKGEDLDGDGTIDISDAKTGPGKYTADQLAKGLDYVEEMGKKYKEENNIDGSYNEAYREYAKSQGADASGGAYFIYYNGQSAGSEPSYMIDPRDGTRYELGDDVPGYGVFYGTHDESGDAANIAFMRECDEKGIEYTYENGILNIIY
jgi:hypothetical protein